MLPQHDETMSGRNAFGAQPTKIGKAVLSLLNHVESTDLPIPHHMFALCFPSGGLVDLSAEEFLS